MYLSRLYLNPRSNSVRHDLADCHQLHRTVVNGFPEVEGTGAREHWDVLHRVDVDAHTGRITLLVQSARPPDWSHLPSGYLDPRAAGPGCKEIDGLYEMINEGDVLRFRLRANPTKRIGKTKTEDPLHGKRVSLRKEEDQLEWLARKGEGAGFRLMDVRALPDGRAVPNVRTREMDEVVGKVPEAQLQTMTGVRKDRTDGKAARLTFGSVLFDGELCVTDTEKFRAALREGIGTGKAYGFGLLSVAPIGR